MNDSYLNFVNSSLGKSIAKSLGLPQPVVLDRYVAGNGFLIGNTLLGAAKNSVFTTDIKDIVNKESVSIFEAEGFDKSQKLKTVIFDASGIANSEDTIQLHEFFNPILRSFGKCTRVVVVGLIPENCPPRQQIAQRSLLGFVKSLGKEMLAGGTVNLIWAESGSSKSIVAPLTFFASDRCAYVSGQVVTVRRADQPSDFNFKTPLQGKNVLVTGAARGIGKAIAEVMHRNGASVTVLDVPQATEDLIAVAQSIQGDHLALDITAMDAGEKIAQHFAQKPLHIIVHNAGITRDKKLANMKPEMWNLVININLASQERINDHLINNNVLQKGGRIVMVSSISGISGNAGQSNYAVSKSGVIGLVNAYAQSYFEKGITINAVAPGFIETAMTAAIPFAIREGGRRLNSMAQGGQPEDVAETIAMFSQDGAQGVYGNVIRVCGLALIGA